MPGNMKVTSCIVTMANESDTQNGGFSFVVTPSMTNLLCINHVPTGISCDNCCAQNCNKLNTVC